MKRFISALIVATLICFFGCATTQITTDGTKIERVIDENGNITITKTLPDGTVIVNYFNKDEALQLIQEMDNETRELIKKYKD